MRGTRGMRGMRGIPAEGGHPEGVADAELEDTSDELGEAANSETHAEDDVPLGRSALDCSAHGVADGVAR